MKVEQGDIVTIEDMKGHFLIASNNFFNETEQVILCPVVQDTFLEPLHIEIKTDDTQGIVMC